MSLLFLKKIRVWISLSFFLLIFFLFIDFGNTLSSQWVKGILFFQFVPSVLKFIQLAAFTGIGFIIVLISALLFGRVYCSFLCPLGTLQDIFIYFSKKFKKRKWFKYAKPKNILRYFFLGGTIIFLLFGSIFILNLLDPYSIFGKISSNLIRPIYYSINNVGVAILERFQNYTLFTVHMKSYNWLSFGISFSVLGLLVWMTYKYGRLYCNAVCPVGTLLGILSRVSIYKIRLNQEACNSCGICGANCKSQCIDTKNKSVDFSRCVGCLNCLDVCASGGVKFSFNKPGNEHPEQSLKENTRRSFIQKSLVLPVGILALSQNSFSDGLADGKKPVNRQFHSIPPGALSLNHFLNACTACHLCVGVCPTHVIQPSFLEHGLKGMMQVYMDFNASFCNFECNLCSDVCPTGAILPIQLETKKLTQLGISTFIKENCVVYTDEKDCGACSEHCPTKAVNMVFYKKDLKIPEVNKDICIGCGACEYACPTTPKSIFVDGNAVHKLADKPKEVKIETIVNPEDDFPF
ncbi:MAG: 4Fe-4S binding protein [Bacteroidales bacterium]|nr:4Fe-4S binding protein [Bacteroidales bacterium]MCF8403178.1 4Fe-4S binding protein [Bacteroidales bacterium]